MVEVGEVGCAQVVYEPSLGAQAMKEEVVPVTGNEVRGITYETTLLEETIPSL